MGSALNIARREYVEGVRSKAFLIGIILAPLIMGISVGVQFLLAAKAPKPRTLVMVEEKERLFPKVERRLAEAKENLLADGTRKLTLRFEPAGDVEETQRRLKQEVDQGVLDFLMIVPPDLLKQESPRVTTYTRNQGNVTALEDFERALVQAMREERGRLVNLSVDQVGHVTAGIKFQVETKTGGRQDKGKAFFQSYMTAFGLVMLLFMTVIGTGQLIMSGVVEEKGNRVIEILLSSVTPRELMLGKIIGIGGVGLTMLGIWSAMGLIGLRVSGKSELVGATSIAYLLVFFLLGFLFFASLMAALGSLCNTEKEAQQLVQPVTLMMALPMMALWYVTQNPDATLTKVLSLIPPFTPFLMMTRMALLTPEPWEIAAGIALLAVSSLFALRAAARIFRLGILMYGKRPSLYEAWKWARTP
jgi:ABC-2 type transport system permease protein